MASNTKLTKESKSDLKARLCEFANTVHAFDFWYDETRGITVMTVFPFNGSNVVHIATSIMSPDEKKFRKSVGRACAFMNYNHGKFIDAPTTVCMDIFNSVDHSSEV